MREIPNPEQFNALLDDIAHQAFVLRDGFRWAHPDAFRRPKHASAEIVSGGGDHDVSDLVASTDRFRDRLRHACREVLEARNRLNGAVADLNDAMTLLEPPPSVEVADVRAIPRSADQGDLERARAAQDRRNVRAAATGDYSEVTG